MALQIVRWNESSKKFEVPSEASKLVRSLLHPVCVLAVSGRARQGKSYLLNQLVPRLQSQGQAARGSFPVGNTVKTCTKGLWLWSKPILRTLPSGQPYYLLLVDVEGIDATDQTADYSNHIFSLALLLSSVLVFNHMGAVDESAMEKLASVCEFARLIRGRTDASGSSSSSSAAGLLSDLWPSFVWLLRDFQFQLTEDGRQLSVQAYMEGVLEDVPTTIAATSEAVRSKNKMRASIREVFRDRHCHALVRPLLEESKLNRLDTLPPGELRPEFRQGLDSLATLLLSLGRPKGAGGGGPGGVTLLNGPALAGLAETYCRVINEGGLPSIATTWQYVIQSEGFRAVDAAVAHYRSRLDAAASAPDVGVEELDVAHVAALASAVELFNKQAVGDASEREPFLRRLRDAAEAAVGPLRAAKRAEAEVRITEMLSAAGRRFLQAMHDEQSDLAGAESQLHLALQQLAADASLGPSKYPKAAELLAGQLLPELRRMLQSCRVRATTAEGRLEELERVRAELTRRAQELKASLDSSSANEDRLELELAAVQAAAAAAGDRAAAAEARGDGSGREVAALRERLAAARAEAAEAAEQAESENNRLRSELARLQSQLAAAQATAQQASAARSAAAQQAAAREAEVVARAAEAESARRTTEEMRATEAQLRRQVDDLAGRLSVSENTRAHLQGERDSMQVQLEDQRRRLVEQEHRLEAAAALAASFAAAATGRQTTPAPASVAMTAAPPLRPHAAGAPASLSLEGAAATPLPSPQGRQQGRGAPEGAGPAGEEEEGGARGRGGGAGRKRKAATAGLPLQPPDRAPGWNVDMDDAGPWTGADQDVVDMTGDDELEQRAAAAGDDGGNWAAMETERPAGRRRVMPIKSPERQRRAAGGAGAGAGPSAGARTPKPAGAAAGAGAAADASTPARPGAVAGAAGAGQATGTPTDVAGRAAGGADERLPGSIERVLRPERSPLVGTTTTGLPAATGATPSRGGPSRTPPPAAAPAASPAPAAAPGSRPELPPNLEGMKIDLIKNWLMKNGYGPDVIELNRKKAPKQAWVDLVRDKCGQGRGRG